MSEAVAMDHTHEKTAKYLELVEVDEHAADDDGALLVIGDDAEASEVLRRVGMLEANVGRLLRASDRQANFLQGLPSREEFDVVVRLVANLGERVCDLERAS